MNARANKINTPGSIKETSKAILPIHYVQSGPSNPHMMLRIAPEESNNPMQQLTMIRNLITLSHPTKSEGIVGCPQTTDLA